MGVDLCLNSITLHYYPLKGSLSVYCKGLDWYNVWSLLLLLLLLLLIFLLLLLSLSLLLLLFLLLFEVLIPKGQLIKASKLINARSYFKPGSQAALPRMFSDWARVQMSTVRLGEQHEDDVNKHYSSPQPRLNPSVSPFNSLLMIVGVLTF